MVYRLRYLNHDIELPQGEFTIGRTSQCQLSLDDPLVSRRHATLRVGKSEVMVEDLASRNGVVVNGKRISGKTKLKAGDCVLIGGQSMTLLEKGDKELSTTASSNMARMTLTSMASTAPVVAMPDPDPESENTDTTDISSIRRADAFRLLGSVAEKALAMGRVEEAERILVSPLNEVLQAGRDRKIIPSSLIDVAGKFGAKLASATGKGSWADYVIELYMETARLCPAVVIDELNNAFRKVNAVDVPLLRTYLEQIRTKLPTLGPADRFLFQRLEGLERLAPPR